MYGMFQFKFADRNNGVCSLVPEKPTELEHTEVPCHVFTEHYRKLQSWAALCPRDISSRKEPLTTLPVP